MKIKIISDMKAYHNFIGMILVTLKKKITEYPGKSSAGLGLGKWELALIVVDCSSC